MNPVQFGTGLIFCCMLIFSGIGQSHAFQEVEFLNMLSASLIARRLVRPQTL